MLYIIRVSGSSRSHFVWSGDELHAAMHLVWQRSINHIITATLVITYLTQSVSFKLFLAEVHQGLHISCSRLMLVSRTLDSVIDASQRICSIMSETATTTDETSSSFTERQNIYRQCGDIRYSVGISDTDSVGISDNLDQPVLRDRLQVTHRPTALEEQTLFQPALYTRFECLCGLILDLT